MKIDFPNKEWHLATKSEEKPLFNNYIFSWNSDEDNEQKYARVFIYIKDIEQTENVLTFFAAEQRANNLSEMEEIFTKESGLINIDNAIGYKSKPRKNTLDIDYESYLIYTIQEGEGVVIIVEYTSNIKSKITPQILDILKSIRV